MNRGKRRKLNIAKASRKKKISEEVYHIIYYDNLHQYSKNKIHCSCPMCSGTSKTNSKHINKGGINPYNKKLGFGTTNHRNGKNWSISDLKQIERMDVDMSDTYYVSGIFAYGEMVEADSFEEAARIFEAENELNGYADLDGNLYVTKWETGEEMEMEI